ncbi:MAG: sugar phosphate isomerase/epimerase [Bryobacteraceae bacterium]|nr:sugar phosphate isomerase/epimerase [Bryobacteraceae bacterium]
MSILSRRAFLAAPALLGAATLEQIPLGVTTDEIDDDLAVAAKFLRESGLRYAEVRQIWGKYNTEFPVEKIREAKTILDRERVQVSVLGTAFFRGAIPADNAALDSQWSLLDAAMERAEVFGANTLRTFAFTYPKGQTSGSPAEYERIGELLREAGKRAKARGFKLGIENLGGSYVSTGAEAGRLLKTVKEDAIGLTWDPNNAGAVGERPFPDGYRQIDPARIFHVHLRDFRKKADGSRWEWCAVGEGEMDNLGQLRALRKDGYKGSFTLETHYRHPDGKAAATRTSLKALLKIIEAV